MLRRLNADQPAFFVFTPANQAWAEAQMTKFPEGRQASAVIPLLWRAQEQEGWLSRPALEAVADMLGMAYIRVLEVATFYFMFQLQPVGQVAHFQICGTTTCMICGAEDLISVCHDKISTKPHVISENGMFSWEEVECLGACANAPMVQIGKDYYEDLTAKKFATVIDDLQGCWRHARRLCQLTAELLGITCICSKWETQDIVVQKIQAADSWNSAITARITTIRQNDRQKHYLLQLPRHFCLAT